MHKISVIVPVYGVEKYIERCARSLFEQTLDEIEYIFVDDCTPDKSIEILEKVLDDYPDRKRQVKIVRLEKNGGLPQARKAGIQQATGDYLIHCDSDDWVDVTMYEKLYRKAVETGADMVWCDYYRVRDGKNELNSQKCENDILKVVKSILDSTLMASVCNRLYKRRLHRADFIYPVENMTEDFVYTLQLLLNSEKIAYLPESLYYYRQNPVSITKQSDENAVLKRFKSYKKNCDLALSIMEKYRIEVNAEYIVYRKYLCKEQLGPILHIAKYKELFIETYPEINSKIYFNRLIRLKSKVKTFLAVNGYSLLYKKLWDYCH